MMDEQSRIEINEGIMTSLEAISPLIDAAGGYKRRAEAAGFCERAAEAMAFEWHSKMLADLLSGTPIPGGPSAQ